MQKRIEGSYCKGEFTTAPFYGNQMFFSAQSSSYLAKQDLKIRLFPTLVLLLRSLIYRQSFHPLLDINVQTIVALAVGVNVVADVGVATNGKILHHVLIGIQIQIRDVPLVADLFYSYLVPSFF